MKYINYSQEEYTLPKNTMFEEALQTSNKYENITVLCATEWSIRYNGIVASRYVLWKSVNENGSVEFRIGCQDLQFPNVFCEKFDIHNDYKIYFTSMKNWKDLSCSYFGDALDYFDSILRKDYQISKYNYISKNNRVYVHEYMHYSIEKEKLVPKPRKEIK